VRVWVATVVRLVLAAVWALVAVARIGDPGASVDAVRAYQLLPDVLERGIGYGLPFVALALAVLLLLGLAVRVAAAVSAVLFLLQLVGLVAAAARGLRIRCGCLGAGGVLPTGQQATAYPQHVAVVAVLLVLGVALAWWPATRFALDDVVRRSAAAGLPDVRVGPRQTAEARRRQAELAEARAAAGRQRMQFVGALAGVLLILAAGIGIGVQAARARSGPSPQAVSVANGVQLGRSGARVTIELYEDPLCANCKTFVETAGPQLQAWLKSSTATVKYYVVSYLNNQSPTKYPSRAAAAMYCAADAGRFLEYHDIVFGDQPAPGTDVTDAELIADGPRAGITGQRQTAFAQCVKSGKYADLVSQVTEQASRDGILATPTLLVDSKPVQRVTLEGVTAAVDAAL
jgi:protein-disulfide isomerase